MALRRTHRVAMTAAVAAMALLLGACSSKTNKTPAGGGSTAAKKTLKVGLAYDVGGRGVKSFNDLAAAGLE